MKLSKKLHSVVRWTSKVLAILILLFGLPFYFGYGNPLPFMKPDYSIWDNIWLTVFPLVFIGLGLGLKYEKTGGYIITTALIAGFLLGLIVNNDFSIHMFIPFINGLLYLISGYTKEAL